MVQGLTKDHLTRQRDIKQANWENGLVDGRVEITQSNRKDLEQVEWNEGGGVGYIDEVNEFGTITPYYLKP